VDLAGIELSPAEHLRARLGATALLRPCGGAASSSKQPAM
jgi:hypothetical protein